MIFEQLFSKKKLFDFKVNFNYLFYAKYNFFFYESSIIFCNDQRNWYHFKDLDALILNIYSIIIFNKN